MAIVERTTSSLVDVIERILDKGIVIDAWIAVSVIGIELITIEARVIVASVETYVKYSEALYVIGPVAGGQRSQQNKRSLGEAVKDVTQGLEGLPLLGATGQSGQSEEKEEKKGSKRTAKRRTTKSRK